MKRALIGLVAILMLVAMSLGISSSTGNIAYAQETNPKEPFTTKIENNKYIINYSGDMVYVGKDTDTFVPEITMYRFGQECSLTLYEPTINGNTLSQKNAGSTLTGDTIQWASKDIQFLFYPKNIDDQNDKGSFEYEIVIANSKAGTDEILSSISFPITSSGLNFYYQPELTQEEMDEGAYRPDNVVGSYAVYHSTKRDHIIGQTNYRAGKAFHIYRPMLIDNAGDITWADLMITDTELIIDFSKIQDWLSKAKYPVRIDPTFGYTTAGASMTPIEDEIKGSGGTPSAGTGDTIHAYLGSSSGAHKAKAALYDADGNGPIDNGICPEISISYVIEWKTFTFSVSPSLSEALYHIPIWGKSAVGTLYIYYDSPVADKPYCAEDIAYNGWPESIEIVTSIGYSAYCTYTPSGAVSPDPPIGFLATDNLTDKVTCTWTKSTGATKYQVYRDGAPIGGELGDVDTFDDFTAGASTITPGNAVASDGTSIAHIALSIVGESANDGTTYSYKVRAGNVDGWSGDSNIDDGKRIPGVLTYQWQRSAGDSDAGYDNIAGAANATYEDDVAPAGTVTPGVAIASDGAPTAYVTLSVVGEHGNDGAGRYYQCVLSATDATGQTSASNRGYRGTGAITYQWQRSADDSDVDYSTLIGATTDPYNDTTTIPEDEGRWYYCEISATGAVTQDTNHDRGYLGKPEIAPDETEPLSAGGIILRAVPIVIACVICIFVIRHNMDAKTLLFGALVGLLAFLIVNALIKLVNG